MSFIVALAIARCAAIQIVRGRGDAFAIAQNLPGNTSLLASAALAGCAVTASLTFVYALACARSAAILVICSRGDALTIAENLPRDASPLAGTLFTRSAVTASFAFVCAFAVA